MSPLRGHAYYVEFAGRRSGGPWLWLLALAAGACLAVEALSHAAR